MTFQQLKHIPFISNFRYQFDICGSLIDQIVYFACLMTSYLGEADKNLSILIESGLTNLQWSG